VFRFVSQAYRPRIAHRSPTHLQDEPEDAPISPDLGPIDTPQPLATRVDEHHALETPSQVPIPFAVLLHHCSSYFSSYLSSIALLLLLVLLAPLMAPLIAPLIAPLLLLYAPLLLLYDCRLRITQESVIARQLAHRKSWTMPSPCQNRTQYSLHHRM
jgi:hypothetical protein